MQSSTLSLVFAAFLLASVVTKLWLANRQIRHVAQHRSQVPAGFDMAVGLYNHQRAADYTVDKLRFDLITTAISTAVLVGWTLLGGLDALNVALRDALVPNFGHLAYQLALLLSFGFIGGLIDLPLAAWSTFRIEQRHGFNRMSFGMWIGDQFKEGLLGLAWAPPSPR